jgi:hypothetical protein
MWGYGERKINMKEYIYLESIIWEAFCLRFSRSGKYEDAYRFICTNFKLQCVLSFLLVSLNECQNEEKC